MDIGTKLMKQFERILVLMDWTPVGALCRVAAGFFFVPALSFLRVDVTSGWTLGLGLVMLLIGLRVLPLVIRRVIPFSAEGKAIWFERRQIAKRYDSYQWQKLFFVGTGLLMHAAVSGELPMSKLVISGFCVVFGAIGLARWYIHGENVRKTLTQRFIV